MNAPHAVVAGFDGSADSRTAVEYAARAARDLNFPLRVVHCYAWSQSQTAVFHAAARMLAGLCEALEPHFPELHIQPIIVSRSPASALIGESRSATMVVVGRAGLGTFGGLHTSAVSRQVANQAICPVVVTPSETDQHGSGIQDGPVLLGLDEENDPIATAYAFAEAARRDVALYSMRLTREGELPTGLNEWAAMELNPDVDMSLVECHERHPGVALRNARLAKDAAADQVLAATHGAGLMVIGASGTGYGKKTRLGGLSSILLNQAACPVAVVESTPR